MRVAVQMQMHVKAYTSDKLGWAIALRAFLKKDSLSYMKLLMTWFFMMGGDRLYGSMGMGPPATDANATA